MRRISFFKKAFLGFFNITTPLIVKVQDSQPFADDMLKAYPHHDAT